MRYDSELGIFGNISQLYKESTKTNNTVLDNKNIAERLQAQNEDIMCELDSIDRIAEIEDALCELDKKILALGGK